MLIRKAFRVRLEPDEVQRALFTRTAGICRLVWNLALEQRTLAWSNQRRRVGYNAQAGELGDLKAAYAWVKEAPSHCLQQVLRDLDRAFRNFFEGRAAYPRRKRKFQHDAFRFPDPKQFRMDGDRMFLPKAGWLRFRKSREIEGTPKQITVSRDGDHWFASFLCEMQISEPARVEGPAVGIDLGVVQAITLSTGEAIPLPTLGTAEQKQLARRQRNLARKPKGSRNRAKARTRLAKFHRRVRNRRQDALHKATTRLAQSHSLLVVEDLRVKAMTASAKGTVESPGKNVRQKAGLNRAILDRSWGGFRRQLEYKAAWYGSAVLAVDPAYTSLRCRVCGHAEAGNRPDQATFRCLRCGHGEHPDVHAAKNILAAGLAVSACGGAA